MTSNDIIDYHWKNRGAVHLVFAFGAVLGFFAIVRLWRLLYASAGAAALAGALFAGLQVTSVDIHAFDHSWDVGHELPLDAKITRMAKRAEFDAYVCIPPLGRGKLRLDSAARHDSDYDLFFIPTWASDTLVVYRFREDGKPLWKTCDWVET